jgi:hypothetical protein
MVRDTYAYRQVAVQSCLVGDAVLIRPVPGQAYAPSLSVMCSRRLGDTSLYPLGTCFLLSAKLTDRLGGTPFLYAYHGDPDVVMTDQETRRFLAEFRRGRI